MSDLKSESPFSKSDCDKIISRKLQRDDCSVLDFLHVPFGKVSGFLGHHSSLVITIIIDGAEESHKFFVKSLPKVKSQRNYVLDINGFFKEEFFFTKYLNLLTQHSITVLEDVIPICLHTDGENFVFDDLTVKGYRTFRSREPLDIACIKAGLRSLAKLHASAIILEEKAKIKLNEEFEVEFAEAFYADKDNVKAAFKAFRSGFEALIDLTHDDSHKMSKQALKARVFRGIDEQKFFVKPSQRFRNTIYHGDLWTNNVMFNFENEKVSNCVIVDFQSFRYAPPAQDVVGFLHLNTKRQFRESHMREMLEFYYEELDGNFKKFDLEGVITEEEFFSSCEDYEQFALTQTCTHFQVVIMSEEVAAELLGDEERALRVLFEDKYEFVVKTCEKDEIYRNMNFEALAELRDFYEKCEIPQSLS